MYFPEEERIMGQKDFDTRIWKYKYSWLDKSEAGQKQIDSTVNQVLIAKVFLVKD